MGGDGGMSGWRSGKTGEGLQLHPNLVQLGAVVFLVLLAVVGVDGVRHVHAADEGLGNGPLKRRRVALLWRSGAGMRVVETVVGTSDPPKRLSRTGRHAAEEVLGQRRARALGAQRPDLGEENKCKGSMRRLKRLQWSGRRRPTSSWSYSESTRTFSSPSSESSDSISAWSRVNWKRGGG